MKLLEGEQVGSNVIIDESNVKEAYAVTDVDGTYAIGLTLDSEGSNTIAQTTETQLGKRLAIFLDGELVCSPEIKARIGGGRILIPAHFTRQEAEHMAAGIKAAKEATAAKNRSGNH